jgi:phosphopantetheinyl transferase (holo-ACP synthase)
MVLHGGGLVLLRERGAGAVLISLTHTDHYAAASAVLVSA